MSNRYMDSGNTPPSSTDTSNQTTPNPPMPPAETTNTLPNSVNDEVSIDRKPHLSLPLIISVLMVILITSLGAYFISTRNTSPEILSRQIPQTELPTVTPISFPLTLTSPTNGELEYDKEIVVKGHTLPGITVAIYTGDDETIIDSDATGSFETTVKLASNSPQLVITAFSSQGEEKSISLDVRSVEQN